MQFTKRVGSKIGEQQHQQVDPLATRCLKPCNLRPSLLHQQKLCAVQCCVKQTLQAECISILLSEGDRVHILTGNYFTQTQATSVEPVTFWPQEPILQIVYENRKITCVCYLLFTVYFIILVSFSELVCLGCMGEHAPLISAARQWACLLCCLQLDSSCTRTSTSG